MSNNQNVPEEIRATVKGLRTAMRSYALQWRSWIAQDNDINADFALRRAKYWRDMAKERIELARRRFSPVKNSR